MADTPEQNSLAAEFERLEDRLRNAEQVIKELTERVTRLELYNYRLQSGFVSLARKD